MADKQDALYDFGVGFMAAFDRAFDAGLTIDEIAAEIEYQIQCVRENPDYAS